MTHPFNVSWLVLVVMDVVVPEKARLAIASFRSKNGFEKSLLYLIYSMRQCEVHIIRHRLAELPLLVQRRWSTFVIVLASVLYSAPIWPANGMVSPGNGTTQLGMAGAGTASAEDAAATLRNPAAGAWLKSGMAADLGIAVPDGGFIFGELGPNARFGLLDFTPGRDTAVQGVFPIPSFARNWRLDDRVAIGWGLTAAGLKTLARGNTSTLARGLPAFEAHCNGALGGGSALTLTTDLLNLCGGTGPAHGTALTQILVSAQAAYRVTPNLSIGIAPVAAFQLLKMRGLGAFAAFSNYPDQTSENATESSYGGGLRLGTLWEIFPSVAIGLAYQSRIYTTEFDRFRGGIITGALDSAPIIDFGLQIHFIQDHRFLFDVEHIAYSKIKPLANRVEPQQFTDGCFVPRLLTRTLLNPPKLDDCLGGTSGPGFGWQDVTVYKFGYEGRSGRLTFRSGYSFGGNPVASGQVLNTVFAPAITDKHASVGLSWKLSTQLSFNWALIYAIENRIHERNAVSSVTPAIINGTTLVGFRADQDPDDQMVEIYLSVWQSQLSMTWTFD